MPLKKDEELLNILPVETSVADIKDLIEEWEAWADKYKIEPQGESICRKIREVT